jgi:hypothetical protein
MRRGWGRRAHAVPMHDAGTGRADRATARRIAVLVALGAAALANGHASESAKTPGGNASGRVIKVLAKVAHLKLIDLADPGFGVGDEVVLSDDLLSGKNGKTAGLDGGVCTVVRVADSSTQSGTMQCLLTLSLKQGQVTAQALFTVTNGRFTGKLMSAITGGTGRFRKSAGELTIEELTSTEANVTLSIRK